MVWVGPVGPGWSRSVWVGLGWSNLVAPLFTEYFIIHQQELFQLFFSSLPRGKWLDRPDREKPKFGFGRSFRPNLRSSSALVANATGHITHKVPIKDKITFRVVVLAKTLPKSN